MGGRINFLAISILLLTLLGIILTACNANNPTVGQPAPRVEIMEDKADSTATMPVAGTAEEPPVVNEEPVKEAPPVVEDTREEGLLPDRAFDIEDLGRKISQITNKTEVFREDNRSIRYLNQTRESGRRIYTNNNEYKTWVVELIDKKSDFLTDWDSFYNHVDARKWAGWRYYINETWWSYLHKPLTEKEYLAILPDHKYKTEYKTDLYSQWTDKDVTQKNFEVGDNLSIVQYEMFTMIFTPETDDHYWIGNREPFFLIYKIPCTKDMVIYYRPRYDQDASTSFWNQKKPEVMAYWERGNQKEKEEARIFTAELIKFCGIKKGFFEKANVLEYQDSEVLVHNWDVYYTMMYNYSLNYSVSTKPTRPGLVEIEQVNVSFSSYSDEPYLGLLRIKVDVEERGHTLEYANTGFVNRKPEFGEVYKISLHKQFPEISSNFTLVLRPYFGYEESTDWDKWYLRTEKYNITS